MCHFDCHCTTSSQDKNGKNVSPMEAVSEVKTRVDHIWTFSFLTPYRAHSWTTTYCTRIVTTLLKCVQILTTASRCVLAQRLRHMARERTPPPLLPPPHGGSTRKMDFVHLINGFLRSFKVSTRTHTHARAEAGATAAVSGGAPQLPCHMDSSFIYSR